MSKPSKGVWLTVLLALQATIQGFQSKGFSKEEGETFLRRSVEIACQERDLFWEEHQQQVQEQNVGLGKVQRALVAASIGSYGAYLADGSEYRYVNAIQCPRNIAPVRAVKTCAYHVIIYSCKWKFFLKPEIIQRSSSPILALTSNWFWSLLTLLTSSVEHWGVKNVGCCSQCGPMV